MRAPTWAAAAAQVGVSPSALSQGLAELERRLGVVLFVPEGRRRVPTDEAAPVVAHARQVLAATRSLARWATEVRAGRSGRVRLGMIDTAAVDRYPQVLRAFRTARPDVELHLTVAPSGTLLAALRDDDLDLVVCVAPDLAPAGLHLVPLADEPLAVYAPPGRRPTDPAAWGPWVTFPAGSHTRAVVAAALAGLGAPFEVVAESHQPEVLAEMVRLGLGWTVLPPTQAERRPDPLRRARRRPLTSRHLVLARRDGAPAAPAVDALAGSLAGTAVD